MKRALGSGVLFLLLSAIPAAVLYFNYDAIGLWRRTKMLTADGLPVTAQVVSSVQTHARTDTYSICVRYSLPGQSLVYQADFEVERHNFARAKLTQRIDLLIDKSRPERSIVKGDETYLVSLVKVMFLDALVLVAAAAFFRHWFKTRRGVSATQPGK